MLCVKLRVRLFPLKNQQDTSCFVKSVINEQAGFWFDTAALSNYANRRILEGTPVKKSDRNLIWIDLEMTGLDPKKERIIEIATVVTNSDLSGWIDGPVFAIHQPNELLAQMDEWNQTHHGASGLTDRVRNSGITTAEAEAKTIAFLQQYVDAGLSPICGNSVHQDKRFLYNEMPKLAEYFHYRHLDVSSFKIAAERWAPDVLARVKKQGAHRALVDIHESIEEMRVYHQYLLNIPHVEDDE
jgi:oligoribonuclease